MWSLGAQSTIYDNDKGILAEIEGVLQKKFIRIEAAPAATAAGIT